MDSAKNLGEKEIIQIIRNQLKMPKTSIPFGDDVSAISIDGDKLAVLKTDMLVGKTDVPFGMSLRQAARKAVVMNISDFAAKGVKPLIMLVSLGLPRGFNKKEVMEIGKGLNEGAREYDTYIIGGDTNESSDLIISCSLLGFSDKEKLVSRFGARPGDLVAVTGKFGKTAAGLRILLERLSAPKKIEEILIESVLMPKARLKEGLALSRTGGVTASIDSSDGLAWSLYELSDASDVGFTINNVPIAREAIEFARIYGFDPLELGLYGGEEYELIVTIKPELWGKVEEAVKKAGGSLLKIGVATKDKKIILKAKGETRPIDRRGWEHFKT